MIKKTCIAQNEDPIAPEVSALSDCYRKIQFHPCFSEDAHHKYGRMHLAVAPKCQIKCNYCDRSYDCVNESRPGVTSRVLSPDEAFIKAKEVISKYPFIKVIAVAGPGEPLYNNQTFTLLTLVKEAFPHLKLCISTNGLALPDKLDILDKLGVSTITVTINAINPKVGKEIYTYVNYQGKKVEGQKAAEILLERQLIGVKGAVDRGIIIKVNTVLIPSINDKHIIDIARQLMKLRVYMMNIMPLIPLPKTKFGTFRRPSIHEIKKARKESSTFIKQMSWCRQCRADAVGLLGRDLALDSHKKVPHCNKF